jgi:GNAT superfamily N-acetyltransferase
VIRYSHSTSNLTASQLEGFFADWPNPPTPATHLRLLQASDLEIVAIDDDTGKVVGFATAVTDGLLCAYLSFLEVLPAYRHRGIGQTLVHRTLELLGPLYMVDTMCDAELQPFYARLGMHPALGMVLRDHSLQNGRPVPSPADT